MNRILWLLCLCLMVCLPVSLFAAGTSAFSSLGIELKEDIMTTYFEGDAILISGRVTNGRDYAFAFLQNVKTGEEFKAGTRTDSSGNFSIPFSLPTQSGKYYIIVAGGNSFSSSLIETITIVPRTSISSVRTTNTINPPQIQYTTSPYLTFAQGVWQKMQITQGSNSSESAGKIIMLKNIPLSIGQADIKVNGRYLSSPSSVNHVPGMGFAWTGTVWIDRSREVIGANLVDLTVKSNIAKMRFRIKKGEQVKSEYFLTSPNGGVTKMTFPQSLTTADGYLKTDIWIEQLFAVPEIGVYKIETVRSNGIAYFNLPVSRNIFWSVKEIFSDSQKSVARSDLRIVSRAVVKKINIVRAQLRKKPLEIDPVLTQLAQAKAADMAKYNYVGHQNPSGLFVREYGESIGIKLTGNIIGENVAGGTNVSDMYLQDGLEESGSHRFNMIDDRFTKVGIGYVLKNKNTYLVQVFGN